MKTTFTIAAAVFIAGCALIPSLGVVELPAPDERNSLGVWDIGEHCLGGIQKTSAAGTSGAYYWVIDCRIRIGYGHCTHGLPLTRNDSAFSGKRGALEYRIRDDGGLDEYRDGELKAMHRRVDRTLCGVS